MRASAMATEWVKRSAASECDQFAGSVVQRQDQDPKIDQDDPGNAKNPDARSDARERQRLRRRRLCCAARRTSVAGGRGSRPSRGRAGRVRGPRRSGGRCRHEGDRHGRLLSSRVAEGQDAGHTGCQLSGRGRARVVGRIGGRGIPGVVRRGAGDEIRTPARRPDRTGPDREGRGEGPARGGRDESRSRDPAASDWNCLTDRSWQGHGGRAGVAVALEDGTC